MPKFAPLIKSGVAACLLLICGASHAAIEEFSFSDTRGVGMGGAYSAAVKDSYAVVVNPAALGFMAQTNGVVADNNGLGKQDFGWKFLTVGAEGTLTGDLGDYLQVLADTDFSGFDRSTITNNISELIELAGVLGAVNDNDTVIASANAGMMVQVGHFGVGVRSFGQVGGFINDLDLVNLGLNFASSEIRSALEEAIANDDGFDPVGYEYQTFDQANVDKIRDAFSPALPDEDTIAYLDHKVSEKIDEGALDREKLNKAVDVLAKIIEASDLGTQLSDNTTSVTGRGFLAFEVPVSYGYAFNENFSAGLTARAIFGRVYGVQVWAFNDDNDEILEDSLDSSVDRINVGLDAAMMYRIPKWQFALVGHNLNRPTFDGYHQEVAINGTNLTYNVPDVVLDPQISFGAAWIPHKRVTFATELELLEAGTLINSYNVQRLSFGTELDLSLVALQLGTYKNLAESDIGWVMTAGVGLQLWAVSVDLGGAVSINDTVNYDGQDYPRTLRLNAALSMDF